MIYLIRYIIIYIVYIWLYILYVLIIWYDRDLNHLIYKGLAIWHCKIVNFPKPQGLYCFTAHRTMYLVILLNIHAFTVIFSIYLHNLTVRAVWMWFCLGLNQGERGKILQDFNLKFQLNYYWTWKERLYCIR